MYWTTVNPTLSPVTCCVSPVIVVVVCFVLFCCCCFFVLFVFSLTPCLGTAELTLEPVLGSNLLVSGELLGTSEEKVHGGCRKKPSALVFLTPWRCSAHNLTSCCAKNNECCSHQVHCFFFPASPRFDNCHHCSIITLPPYRLSFLLVVSHWYCCNHWLSQLFWPL